MNQARSLLGRRVRLTFCIRREYGEGRWDRDEVIEGVLTMGRRYLVTAPGLFSQGVFLNIDGRETFLGDSSPISYKELGMNGAYVLETIE